MLAACRIDPQARDLPAGYWREPAVRAILDKTRSSELAPDLSALTTAERRALGHLVAAGRSLQDVFETQLHHQALRSRAELRSLHRSLGRPARTADLLRLYDLSGGPIATTLDNELLPFLPVDGYAGGKNVYPWGIGRDELARFLERRPAARSAVLGPRSVVRRTTPASLRRDLAALHSHPILRALHPELQSRLTRLQDRRTRPAFHAVPYSVAWPRLLLAASERVRKAGVAIEGEDPDFGAYLVQRSRDLLTDDFEPGDAMWVRGSFGRLDAVIGAHETYDDDLFGAKTFYATSIFIRDELGAEFLRTTAPLYQGIEDALPCQRHRTVAEVRVGSHDIVAAFGVGRGTQAEILPNDPNLIRKYGRKIMFRRNLSFDPVRFSGLQARWNAVMLPAHHGELTPEGCYQQVIWHEIGHDLGPDVDLSGRSLEQALAEDAAPIEELKAELVSQFAAGRLYRAGRYTRAELHGVIAAAIRVCLRQVRPLRSQDYPTLWLMELNYFLEHGVLVYRDGRLGIRYERHAATVEAMLREVLGIQERGSRDDATALIDRYTTWDDRHEAIARQLRAAEPFRNLHTTYGVLGDPVAQASSRR